MIELYYFVFNDSRRPDLPGPFYAWPMFPVMYEGINSMMAMTVETFGG